MARTPRNQADDNIPWFKRPIAAPEAAMQYPPRPTHKAPKPPVTSPGGNRLAGFLGFLVIAAIVITLMNACLSSVTSASDDLATVPTTEARVAQCVTDPSNIEMTAEIGVSHKMTPNEAFVLLRAACVIWVASHPDPYDTDYDLSDRDLNV